MTERLDRIEALLENTQQQLNQTAEKQTKNTEEIDLLLGAVATSEAKVDKLIIRAEAADQRFEVLRAEAATDRQEYRQSFNDAIEQMRIDREDAKTQADADRKEARERADADRRKADERHSAQMEVIQTLLLELTKTNNNVTKLRDRMDILEKAN
ncbi:hypothetical protein [cf. Phormidesmis sp. LEGE 11477]|uniref:hypothetical protein n=1 Tax=cf. Phormidesmis sp. LEGE 11477 TaxID=1828680 RepID=UPI001882B45E|nr:hypothetical protein [cf. Phormidesmis sp. LEGE 11477]MBE9063469.1 hypothetical protein [cf. Phormidesmis sp. LEGE 11477]